MVPEAAVVVDALETDILFISSKKYQAIKFTWIGRHSNSENRVEHYKYLESMDK